MLSTIRLASLRELIGFAPFEENCGERRAHHRNLHAKEKETTDRIYNQQQPNEHDGRRRARAEEAQAPAAAARAATGTEIPAACVAAQVCAGHKATAPPAAAAATTGGVAIDESVAATPKRALCACQSGAGTATHALKVCRFMVSSPTTIDTPEAYSALQGAVAMGDARIVRYLIEKDVRLDPLPYAGATTDMAPLAIACLHGHMEIAELLLASGAHINGVSLIDTSLSPLLDTVRHGRVEMVQWLVDNGARVDILDKNGEMPILSAASQGRRRIVDVLLAAIPSDAASARDTYYSLMRTESASSGSFDVLKHLVEHGVGKFDSHDGKRADILGAAVRSQRVEMVRYILKKREFERGESMTTSLFVAIYARRSDIAELLIAHGADFYDLRSTFGESSVHFAIKGGMVSTLEVMFRCELDIGHLMPDHQGRTVMHAIAEYGDVRMLALVKRMFGDTLDLNACTSFGDQTPFQLACENGRADAVEFLLAEYPSGSFDINFCNSFHNTALKLAASRGHLDIVIRLLHAGALVETGGAGYSALAAAAGAGHFEVVELLCGHGASVNEGSVLHSVARGGHAPMLEYLIEKWHASMVYRTRDAELSLLDVAVPHPHLVRALLSYSGAELESDLQQSSSALCRAVLRGNFEAVQLLVRYGANVNAPFTSTQDDGQRDLELTPLTAAALAGDLGVVAYLCENGADLELATDQNETVLYLAVARGLVNWSRTCSQSTAWEWNTEQQWGSVQWRSQNATKRSQSGPEGCRPESCSCWKAMERGLRGSSFTRSTTRRGCWKLQAYATGRQRMLAQFVDGVVKQYW